MKRFLAVLLPLLVALSGRAQQLKITVTLPAPPTVTPLTGPVPVPGLPGPKGDKGDPGPTGPAGVASVLAPLLLNPTTQVISLDAAKVTQWDAKLSSESDPLFGSKFAAAIATYDTRAVNDTRYAPLSHTQAISTVTGLQAALDGKEVVSRKIQDVYQSQDPSAEYPSVAALSNYGDDLDTHARNRANHFGTQPPSSIVQDASNRFVTDAEKAAWNGKQAALGYTAENAANKATSLTSPDNTKYPTTKAVSDEVNAAYAYVDQQVGEVTDFANSLSDQVATKVSTGNNVGTGAGVFDQKVGTSLQFKTLKASGAATVSATATEITITTPAQLQADWNQATSSAPDFIKNKPTIPSTTSQISEGGNLYYTDTRARGAVSLTTTGTSGAATYNSTTGVLNIPNYATGVGGSVTSFSAGNLTPLFTTSVATATTTPALSFSLSNAAQNAVLAGPSSGGAGAPTYRALVPGDIPTLNQSTTGTASNVTGTVAIGNGGTGQTTASAAFDALSPNTTLGDMTYRGSSGNLRLPGNSTATKQFLSQTGTGSASAAPVWSGISTSDVSGIGSYLLSSTAASTYAPLASPTFTGTTTAPYLIFPSTGTGFQHYNTSDQTTNYERLTGKWVSNSFLLGNEFGGTGSSRDLYVGVAATAGNNINRYLKVSAAPPFFSYSWTSTGLAGYGVDIGGNQSFVASSGNQGALSITPTINQTSTAGYRALFISPYQQATGSGTQLLLDVGTNSAAAGGGTHTSRFSVTTGGGVTWSGTATGNGSAITNLNADNLASGTVPSARGGAGTVSGLMKANGSGVVSVATSGTDYAPGTSGLGTGIVKSTTGTGALSIAVASDFPTLNQSTTGNAATATALQTARTINGVSFDGTANITVADNTKISNGGNVPSITSGTLASRPTAGTSGRLYIATDNLTIYRDNGTSWDILEPALTGDVTLSAGGTTTTLATVNSNVGTFGSATTVPVITVDGKGRVTAVSTASVSGGSGPTTLTLSSSATENAGTATNASGISWTGAANTTYYVTLVALFQGSATSTGLQVGFTLPSGASQNLIGCYPLSTGGLPPTLNGSSGTFTASTTVPAATTTYAAVFQGSITVGSTSGTIQLQFRRGGTGTVTLVGGAAGSQATKLSYQTF